MPSSYKASEYSLNICMEENPGFFLSFLTERSFPFNPNFLFAEVTVEVRFIPYF